MGSFLTKGGRCVVEHGEVRLKPIGFRGRLERSYENVKLAHRQRYERSLLRFGFVILLVIYSIGMFSYRVLFGDREFALLGVAVVTGILVLGYGYLLVRKFIRRQFRGFTAEQAIPLRTIESVDPRPKELFRRPSFIVHYDEYGVEKKRYVGVCSLSPLADDEFEEAKMLFFDEYDLSIADS